MDELTEEPNPVNQNLEEIQRTLKNVESLLNSLNKKQDKPIQFPECKLFPDDFDPEQYNRSKRK